VRAGEHSAVSNRSVTSKVLAQLDAFTPVSPALTLSELARRSGVSLATAHRRAAELVEWGENVQLAVREGLELVFVERIAGRHAVPVQTRVGGRFALHATGVGLALLAHAPAEVQEEVLTAPLHAFTGKTVISPTQLRETLAAVRRTGYAVSDGQVTADSVSVAASITGRTASWSPRCPWSCARTAPGR
jgi:DNA-binding IclR family transcriptional regulator